MTGHIYIVRSGATDLVKIGYAGDVATRITLLQCGNPEVLTLLRTMPGDRWTEARMHERFKARRVRIEWFTFDPAMLTVQPHELPTRIMRGPREKTPDSVAAKIIDDLGGSAKVAADLGIGNHSTVSHWRARGIPSRYWPDVVAMATEKEIEGVTFDALKARPQPLSADAA